MSNIWVPNVARETCGHMDFQDARYKIVTSWVVIVNCYIIHCLRVGSMYHQYQPLVYYCGKRVIPALGVGLPTRSTVVIPALGVGLPTRSTVFSEENTLKRYRYSVWVNQPGVLYSSQEVFPSRTGQGLKSEADLRRWA